MSISLVTRGRLCPTGGTRVVREQFVAIVSHVDDPSEVTLELQEEGSDISVSIVDNDVSSTVELVDTVTKAVIDSDDVSGNTEGCS